MHKQILLQITDIHWLIVPNKYAANIPPELNLLIRPLLINLINYFQIHWIIPTPLFHLSWNQMQSLPMFSILWPWVLLTYLHGDFDVYLEELNQFRKDILMSFFFNYTTWRWYQTLLMRLNKLFTSYIDKNGIDVICGVPRKNNAVLVTYKKATFWIRCYIIILNFICISVKDEPQNIQKNYTNNFRLSGLYRVIKRLGQMHQTSHQTTLWNWILRFFTCHYTRFIKPSNHQ